MLLRDLIKHHMLAPGEVERLAQMVLPGGRELRSGRRFEGIGPDGHTWSINTGDGDDRGVYGAWAAGHHGDVVHFVTRGGFNDDFRRLLPWARHRYGLDRERLQPEALRLEREQAEQAERIRAQRRAESEEERRQRALRVLDSPGDVRCTRSYLAGRGLDVNVPYLQFGEAIDYDLAPPPFPQLPAMLAPVRRLADGACMAVHRTYLRQDESGVWRKAALKKPKLSLGPVSGHVIVLRDGTGVSWDIKLTQQDGVREAICLAEGVENALTGSLMFPHLRCAAYISHGNLPKVVELLPPWVHTVVLMFDRDAESNGRDDIRRSRETAIACLLAQGRRVFVVAPVVGFKDFNLHLHTLISDHGYRPNFVLGEVTLDWRIALAQATPMRTDDPAALYWQRVVGGRIGTGRVPTGLWMHPALPSIEQPDVTLPALLAPVIGRQGKPIGALVAWLAKYGDLWGPAPLLSPIRLVGSFSGVVPIAIPRRMPRRAQLVVGLANALALAYARPRQAVFCVLDPTHATVCASGIPGGIDAVDLLIENDDVSLGSNLLAEIAARRLNDHGIAVEIKRPWDEYADIATMLREVGDVTT